LVPNQLSIDHSLYTPHQSASAEIDIYINISQHQ
jgi:hypothetical protein